MQKLRQDVSIGNNIRTIRVRHGFTQELTASKLQLMGSSVTRGIYSRYETGELNIRISDLVLLRRIFRCRYDDFFIGLDEIIFETDTETPT